MQPGFRLDPYAAYYPSAYPFAAVDPTDPTDVSINSTDALEALPRLLPPSQPMSYQEGQE